MEDTLHRFEIRQQALRRKHMRMAKGYVTKLTKDGLFVHQPDKKAGRRGLRLLISAVVGLLLFKSFVLYWLGTDTYQGHVNTLASGTSFEKIGAFLMQIDPITSKLAELAQPFAV